MIACFIECKDCDNQPMKPVGGLWADNKGAFLMEAKSSAYGDLGARATPRAS